jgi:Mn-containing catalase
MLTEAGDGEPGEPGDLGEVKGVRNTQHFIAGGAAALVQDSNGKPWNGGYVFASGDLIEDLTHNFFLETGARNNKLKVYEMVDHPAARALTGYLLVRRRASGRVRPRDRAADGGRADEAVLGKVKRAVS